MNRARSTGGVLLALAATAVLTTASVQVSGPDTIAGDPSPAAPGPGSAGDGAADAGPATPGADGAGDPYYPDDGNGGYDVQHYDVAIDYDPDRQRLDGDATITARATQSLSRFNLDLFALRAAEAWVDDAPAAVAREGRHELVITPATPIAEGATFRVRVRYDGQPGLFEESGLGAGGWYANETGGAVAAGEPHSATAWYPANDTPRDKATFALTATVPEGWTVISNGTDEPVSTRDGRSTFRWRLDEPVATYLTTVAIDRFTVRRSTLRDGTPVIDAYAPGAEDARADQERLPEIIEFLEEKFGPYPFDSAGGIFLSASIGYALELQTRPVYSPDPGVQIIVHENAHQWFGNSVTVSSWADICLNECFASYAQWLWNEHEGENLDERYRDLVGRVDLAVPLYDMGAGNEFRGVYGKGPLALHALRRTIGDEAFDRVLREWPERHRDGNASWPQFEAFVTEVAGRDLRGFFDAWFHGTERPAEEYLHPGGL